MVNVDEMFIKRKAKDLSKNEKRLQRIPPVSQLPGAGYETRRRCSQYHEAMRGKPGYLPTVYVSKAAALLWRFSEVREAKADTVPPPFYLWQDHFDVLTEAQYREEKR